MKLMIGAPWYTGPDQDTYHLYFDHCAYYGALRERSLWRSRAGKENFDKILPLLPPLDEHGADVGWGEPSAQEWDDLGELQLALNNRGRISLVGKAREMIAEDALDWGADYLLSWDADMLFPHWAFLQLWRAKKPVVAALAFTARPPFVPVMYKISDKVSRAGTTIYQSDTVLDYPRDQLFGSEDLGGELAFGTGLVLYDMKVFRELPKPWFNTTGAGEDWFFCHRCAEYGIPRYVDTRVKTIHKEHTPRWVGEESYWRDRELRADEYKKLYGDSVRRVEGGKLV